MVGNATEEGLLRDIKNPAHRDRPVWPLVLTLALLISGWWLMDLLEPLGLPVWVEVLITAAIAVPVGIGAAMLVRRWTRRPGSAAAEVEIDARRTRQAGLATEIDAARASGAFDRWEAPRGTKR